MNASYDEIAASISDAEQREIDAFERASLEAWAANDGEALPDVPDDRG